MFSQEKNKFPPYVLKTIREEVIEAFPRFKYLKPMRTFKKIKVLNLFRILGKNGKL